MTTLAVLRATAPDAIAVPKISIVRLGENTAEAMRQAVRAETAADAAAASAALAEAVSGPVYASTALGLAATASGDYFAVDAGSGLVSIYLDDAGVAVLQRTLATSAALAASGGSALVGFLQSGTGAVSRTVQAKLRDTIHRLDYATLQDAVNAASTQGKALDLGAEDFTVTNTVTLPNGDYAIFGPGSSALTITFTGTGGLFVGTGLAVTTKLAISGFTARAGAANCGPAVHIGHTSTVGVDIRAVTISDVTADINNVGTNWWSGGFYITEGSLAVFQNCHVHGPTADLTRTAYGFKFDGSAFDCKLSDCGALSVGRGLDIGGTVEGTVLSNFTAVDVNVGVYKSHTSGTVEPWIAMSGWHINARQQGFYFNNVFQTTITNGLLYAANTSGVAEWTGIEIENSTGTNQDLMIDALIDCQLADAATATRGIRIRKGVGISANLKLRDLDIGAELLTATNCVIKLECNTVATPVAGTGAYNTSNAISINVPSLGHMLPQVMGALNPDDSAAAVKAALIYGFGRDTAGAYKGVGGLRIVSVDANWVDALAEIQVRRADSFIAGVTLFGTGTPEGAVIAPVGAIYTRQDGGAGTTLYVKETGAGNTGWVAK